MAPWVPYSLTATDREIVPVLELATGRAVGAVPRRRSTSLLSVATPRGWLSRVGPVFTGVNVESEPEPNGTLIVDVYVYIIHKHADLLGKTLKTVDHSIHHLYGSP